MMALMFVMAHMAPNWELSRRGRARNLELVDLLASPQVITEAACARVCNHGPILSGIFGRILFMLSEISIAMWDQPCLTNTPSTFH